MITLLQALSMAEIVSSLPSSGGPYFWAIHLAPKKGRSPAFAGWMTGLQDRLCPNIYDSLLNF